MARCRAATRQKGVRSPWFRVSPWSHAHDWQRGNRREDDQRNDGFCVSVCPERAARRASGDTPCGAKNGSRNSPTKSKRTLGENCKRALPPCQAQNGRNLVGRSFPSDEVVKCRSRRTGRFPGMRAAPVSAPAASACGDTGDRTRTGGRSLPARVSGKGPPPMLRRGTMRGHPTGGAILRESGQPLSGQRRSREGSACCCEPRRRWPRPATATGYRS